MTHGIKNILFTTRLKRGSACTGAIGESAAISRTCRDGDGLSAGSKAASRLRQKGWCWRTCAISSFLAGVTSRILLLVMFLTIAPAYSATLQEQADTAAVADGVSTLVGLALGAAEANPLGLITIIAKAPLLAAVKKMPQDEQADWHASYSAFWGGAAASNLCIIGVILTGGAAAPFCPVIGVAWGLQKWSESAVERELWAICREERAYWKNPQMPCDFFNKPLPQNEVAALQDHLLTLPLGALAASALPDDRPGSIHQ